MVDLRKRKDGLYEPVYIPDEEVYLTKKEQRQSKLAGWMVAVWCVAGSYFLMKPAIFVLIKAIRIIISCCYVINHLGQPGADFSTENPFYILLHFTYNSPMP